MPATALRVPLARVRLGRLTDERLAALAATGDERAFELLYDRHHAALLGFCRHMLGSREEGEDALQQTFLRAHRALVSHGPPDDVRPWLFAIARNRCRSIHAARKDAATSDADVEPVTDGLSADVEQRSDLRALLADIEQLPEDQRSALVLAELADMPHTEIGAVIGVPGSKVKALVHQARTHLIAERDARETPCEQIREQLATARGGELRRGPLRRHLNRCEPCRAYRGAVSDQRAALGLILPVIPSAGLKDAVLGAIGGGGGGGAAAAAAGGAAGAGAGSAAVSGGGSLGLGAKLAVGAALLGGAGGGTALVETAVRHRPAAPAKQAAKAESRPAVAKAPAKTVIATAPVSDGVRPRASSGAGEKTAATRPGKRRAHAYGKTRNGNNGVRDHGAGNGSSGRNANGNGNGKALGRSGEAGTQDATRRAAVQQRNAQRKAEQVQRRTATKPAKPSRPTDAQGQGQGQIKPKASKPAAPEPEATPAPVTAETPQKASGKAKNDDPVETVVDPALP
jgi:RNA polymerase sigma factor (sigma-70 family)